MNSPLQAGVSLFWLAVGVGALVMFVRHPAKANALIAAGPDTISGIVHGLESGSLN